jgi:hypothetical protein
VAQVAAFRSLTPSAVLGSIHEQFEVAARDPNPPAAGATRRPFRLGRRNWDQNAFRRMGEGPTTSISSAGFVAIVVIA